MILRERLQHFVDREKAIIEWVETVRKGMATAGANTKPTMNRTLLKELELILRDTKEETKT